MLGLFRGHVGVQITVLNFFLIILGYGAVQIASSLGPLLQFLRFVTLVVCIIYLLSRVKWNNAASSFLLIVLLPLIFQLIFNSSEVNLTRSIPTALLAVVIFLSISYERKVSLSLEDSFLVRIFSVGFSVALVPVLVIVMVNFPMIISKNFYGSTIGGAYVSNQIGWSLTLVGMIVMQLKSKWKYFLIIILCLIIIQSGSRSSLLGLLLLGSVIYWKNFILRLMIVGGMLLTSTMEINELKEDNAIIERTQRQLKTEDSESRLIRLEQVFQSVKDDPLLLISGLGQRGQKVFAGNGSYHSSLLFLVFSSGLIVGIPSIYLFYVLPLKLMWRRDAILFLLPVVLVSLMEDTIGAGQFLSVPFYFLAAYSWQKIDRLK